MKVSLNNALYEFKFQHELPRSLKLASKMDVTMGRKNVSEDDRIYPFHGGTSCILYENGEEVHRANVYVYHKDKFDKSVGRKIALDRVLQTFDFDKEDRKSIWTVYLQSHKV